MGCCEVCASKSSVLLFSRTRTHGNVNSRLSLSILLYNCLFWTMEILICFVEGRKGKLTLIYHCEHDHHPYHQRFWFLSYYGDKKRTILTKSNLGRCTGLDEDVPHWLLCLNA